MASTRPAGQTPSASSAAAVTSPHSPSKNESPTPAAGQDSKASAANPGPWRPSFTRQQSGSALSSPSSLATSASGNNSSSGNNPPSRSNSLLRHHNIRTSTPSSSSGHHHPMESPSLSTSAPGLSKDGGYFSQHHHQAPGAGSSSPRLSSPSIYKPSSPGPGGSGSSGGSAFSSLSSSMPSSQPLNLEALAAKFADSKEAKEKFAKLQLSPALSPGGFLDKDNGRRGSGSTSAGAGPSSVLSPNKSHHHHHPRSTTSGHSSPSISSSASFGQSSPMHSPLLRQQSSGHVGSLSALSSSTSPQKASTPGAGTTSTSTATPSSPGGALNSSNSSSSVNGLKSPLSQSTDMRRTASHNSAFATGLGIPVSSNSHAANGSTAASPSSSSGLAPFSLGSIAPTPRRSSLHPDDDPAAPVSASKYKDLHPLQHSWTLYYDVSTGFGRQGSSLHHFESGLKELGTFQSVESFARYFNWIQKPHNMDNSTNYHLFKDGIKPMWEDPANAKGGRWIVTLLHKNPDMLDKYWLELAYALVGEQLDEDDDICGAVLSRRTKADRLAVWVRDRDNVAAINGIGKRLIKLLDLSKERLSMEFQITGDVATTPISTSKRYITLDTIRKEIEAEQQEHNTPQLRRASTDVTTAGSAEALKKSTQASTAVGSTTTTARGGMPGSRKNSVDTPSANASPGGGGLLISVESKDTPMVSVTRTEIEA